MATKKELIYDIKEYFKKYSDDNEYSNRYILYLWNNKRSKYLRRLLNDKTRKFDDVITQDLCVSLEESSPDRCGVKEDCTILRTSQSIPKLLELRSRNTLISVGPTNILEDSFNLISIDEVPFIFSKPYSNGIYVFKGLDDHLYIISKKDSHKLLECIYVKAVFEDPSELENFTNCCNCEDSEQESCFTEDSEYPLQSFLIDPIREEILKQLIPRENINQDNLNNSDEN